MPKTKVFISSVHEDGLKPLRQTAYRELTALGHVPLMWEENFGPWLGHMDPVIQCLEAVEEADIYLLFIGSRSGTYDEQAERTVTHMEFIKAHEQGKTLLVFGDVEVKAVFFSVVKPLIEKFVDEYMSTNERFPAPMHIINSLEGIGSIPSHIDPYVWYFLYDMTLRKVYIDNLALGVPMDWKEYFSDLLRRGALLLPLEHSIEQNSLRLEQLDHAFDLIGGVVPYLTIHGIREIEQWLDLVMSFMHGGIIEKRYGRYMSEKVGYYGDCCGAALYVFEDNQLKLVAKAGDALGTPYYSLDDQGSFTVLTWRLTPSEEQIFYKESNAMFYYGIRAGQYVLSFHFPADPCWDYRTFIHHRECVNHAIISKNPFVIEFIKLVIGGLRP